MSLTCPRHGPQKVRQGTSRATGRSYHYCSQFEGKGKPDTNENGYCSLKPVALQVEPPPVAAPSPPPVAAQHVAPAAAPRSEAVPQFSARDDVPNRADQFRMAALEFAGRLYAGSIPVGATADERLTIEGNALRLANDTFEWLLGPEG